ncbi:unnamed protein product [Spirodela intermedia]|uniref:TPX2 C-terminal domain-containing protein n=1 Tax=Spirodela intermedia TaxID=51605 RepID=A0A7I8LFP9_SPIIN|nr:unnamed protein product [Spirodela intermedia]
MGPARREGSATERKQSNAVEVPAYAGDFLDEDRLESSDGGLEASQLTVMLFLVMAGEIEDRTNFQADCLHSDSVSFGRFESESLSWEKRSSFSRNQYLEEVEKYSTPGSVTKKKAYLEAHFKTKTYLQGLTGTQKGTDGLVENDAEIRDGCVEELENLINEETLNTGESGSHANDEIQFSWYDVTPDIADGHKHEVEEVESEASLYVFPIKVRNSKYISCAPILNIRSLDVDCGERVTATPLIDPSDLDKSTIDTTERVSVRVATGPDKSDVIVHATSVCDSKESDKYDADIVYEEVETIPACDSLDAESSKVNMNSRISACDATEPDKNSVDMVFEQKPEDSVKDMDSEQMDSLSQSCPVKIASSSILEKMSEFTLEFYMKLGEKQQAKEAKISQIQLRTQQEERDAEIRQLRKSLSFKATPMPSFYHEAAPKAYDVKKVSPLELYMLP